MPKITTAIISVFTEKINEKYKVDVNYFSKETAFAIEVPGRFEDAFDHLSKDEMKLFDATVYHKTRHKTDNGKRMVTGSSEAEVISNAKKLLTKLAEVSIIERNVIIAFYDGRGTNKNHRTSEKYDVVGFDIGLTFCVETTIAGGEKKYYEYTDHEAFGEKRTSKRETNIWNSNCIIIDDNEENREFTISLYKAVSELKRKMDEFTETEENFLSLIASKQKLISS